MNNEHEHPALAIVKRYGIKDLALQHIVFEHAAAQLAYHWVCAAGFMAAEVAPATNATGETYKRLVTAFGLCRGSEIDEALFEACERVVAACRDFANGQAEAVAA